MELLESQWQRVEERENREEVEVKLEPEEEAEALDLRCLDSFWSQCSRISSPQSVPLAPARKVSSPLGYF